VAEFLLLIYETSKLYISLLLSYRHMQFNHYIIYDTSNIIAFIAQPKSCQLCSTISIVLHCSQIRSRDQGHKSLCRSRDCRDHSMMFHVGIPALVCVLTLAAFVIHRLIIYPTWISPLAKVPHAHWSCGVSSGWILWTRFRSREISTIHKAHQRIGPVVRLGPNEISVNCIKGGIHTVYSGGFEKHSWYSNLFSNYG
jgi:hypothetical protein